MVRKTQCVGGGLHLNRCMSEAYPNLKSVTDEQPTPGAILFMDRGSMIYLTGHQSVGDRKKKVKSGRSDDNKLGL